MATYNFKCSSCFREINLNIQISEFIKLKSQELNGIYELKNYACNNCKSISYERIFDTIGSKIVKSREEILEGIREETREIVNRVNNGDQNMIRQIYGDD